MGIGRTSIINCIVLLAVGALISSAQANDGNVSIQVQNLDASAAGAVNQYTAKLRQNLQSSWHPDADGQGDARVSFTITPDGELKDLSLQQSSGSKPFDDSVIRSIKMCAPFSPEPQAAALQIIATFSGFEGSGSTEAGLPPQAMDQGSGSAAPQQAPSMELGMTSQPSLPPGQSAPSQPPQLQGHADQTGATQLQGSATELAAEQPVMQSSPPPQAPLQATVEQSDIRSAPMMGSSQMNQFPPRQFNPSANAYPPLPMNAERDSRGTPRIPQWKLDSGYDVSIGNFKVMFTIGGFTLKQINVNGPTSSTVMLSHNWVLLWKGAHPHPCFIHLTPLADGTGGYYFSCMETPLGPCGWVMPQPQQSPSEVRKWAIYYAQR